ncbi:hypothetical protein YC2023_023875 [Brassica napus]
METKIPIRRQERTQLQHEQPTKRNVVDQETAELLNTEATPLNLILIIEEERREYTSDDTNIEIARLKRNA